MTIAYSQKLTANTVLHPLYPPQRAIVDFFPGTVKLISIPNVSALAMPLIKAIVPRGDAISPKFKESQLLPCCMV